MNEKTRFFIRRLLKQVILKANFISMMLKQIDIILHLLFVAKINCRGLSIRKKKKTRLKVRIDF